MEDLVNDSTIDPLDDLDYYDPKRYYSVLARKVGTEGEWVFTHIWAKSCRDAKAQSKKLGLETKGRISRL